MGGGGVKGENTEWLGGVFEGGGTGKSGGVDGRKMQEIQGE